MCRESTTHTCQGNEKPSERAIALADALTKGSAGGVESRCTIEDVGVARASQLTECQGMQHEVPAPFSLHELTPPLAPECATAGNDNQVDSEHEGDVHECKRRLKAVDVPYDVLATWAVA